MASACVCIVGGLITSTDITKIRHHSSSSSSSSSSSLSSKHTSQRQGERVVATTLSLSVSPRAQRQSLPARAIRAESMATEKLGIKIERNPPESKLTQLGVRNWPKWGCPPSKFPWTYDAKETCYLLEGKVKVTPEGSKESVEIASGDLVEFPKGMSCTWDVSETVDKHYNFA